MPRVANPLTKVRNRLEACCFGQANFKNLPKDKDKPSDPDEHLNFYRSHVPIQREIVPRVDEALDLACERLGLDRTMVHGFIIKDPAVVAWCVSNIRGNAVVQISSGMVERFTTLEMAFVFGHELGHFLLPTRWLCNRLPNGTPASMEDAAVYRQIEISMDRFGLVACQDVKVAASACLKLESGLGAENVTDDVTSFCQLARQGFVEDFTEYVAEAGMAHPSMFTRIQALQHFAESEEYLGLIGQKGGRPHAEVDAAVAGQLQETIERFVLRLMGQLLMEAHHHFAAMQALVDGQCEVQRFVVGEMISAEVDLVKSALSDINQVPEASREDYLKQRLAFFIRQAVVRCPNQMEIYLTKLLPNLEGTKLKAHVEGFSEDFRSALAKHRSGEAIISIA
jgi:hypothetical protein